MLADLRNNHSPIHHLQITSVCVALGEYPLVRYYRPNHLPHEARVLCPYLAKFVQQALDEHAKATPSYPPPSTRPRGVLYILDRSLDLAAPLIHEFTYQAMAHDLLPLKEGGDKVYYNTAVGDDREKHDMEISEVSADPLAPHRSQVQDRPSRPSAPTRAPRLVFATMPQSTDATVTATGQPSSQSPSPSPASSSAAASRIVPAFFGAATEQRLSLHTEGVADNESGEDAASQSRLCHTMLNAPLTRVVYDQC
ncbi:vacuolar sorting protein VPS33/slp1 [Ascosphaera acerosa]|nr:vacuolar sorting protein VPS33/slp1 [Ascosphaera acerosa]